MYIHVNGARLYFDVEGAGLVPDGPRMREKPTLLLLHGRPGFDHSMFKPAFSALADIAQLIYYDHRGQGRSDKDPIVPVSLSETMAGCRPQHLVRFERFENCGHGVHRDDPERAFRVLREFILS